MNFVLSRRVLRMGGCQVLEPNIYNVRQLLKTFDTIVYAADGVLWRHGQALTGAADTFNALRAMGKNSFICTNNSEASCRALTKKAHSLGFLIAENEILSSAQALARYMRERKFNRKVYIVGGQGIKDELRQVGIESLPLDLASTQENSMVDQVQKMYLDANVGAVAVGMDLGLNVLKLTKASIYLRDPRTLFLATNRDRAFPVAADRQVPGAGVVVAAIQAVAKRAPFTCGKPSPYVCSHLIRQGVIEPERTLLVGDTMYTDMQFGYNCGFHTLLVGTGVSSLQDVRHALASKQAIAYQQIPDLYLHRLSDLLPFIPSRNY
ncbi:glycerol-3-phosphate phosphatase [Drosophila pseudoobscura]|uniref:Glycerol-3-phosphate phosphatase n=1 Tax=Drosophila pseudoobscura pseudoobscura TaxID=46245 RepID=Q29E41_DROPS|nr:glycerol-3-phosphate phosphatase [Drosophila pseudoobscura]